MPTNIRCSNAGRYVFFNRFMFVCFSTKLGDLAQLGHILEEAKHRIATLQFLNWKVTFFNKKTTIWMIRMTYMNNLFLILVFPSHILLKSLVCAFENLKKELASEWISYNMCLYNGYTLFHYCHSSDILSPGNSALI